jgi:PAS domain S-box-containing protein
MGSGEREFEDGLSREDLVDRELYDRAPVALCTIDLAGRIGDANLAFCSLFGRHAQMLLGMPFHQLFESPDRSVIRQHLRLCQIHRASSSLVTRVPGLLSAAPRTVLLQSAPALGPEGLIGCSTSVVDLSEVESTEARLRFLVDAAATLASSFDYTATIAQVVARCAPMLADEASLQLEGDPLAAGSIQARVLAAGQAVFDETRALMVVPIRSRDHVLGVLTLAMRGSRRSFSAGDLAFAQALASQMAVAIENARRFDAADQSARAREQLLEFVSHDLNNPLNTILLSAATLARTTEGARSEKQERAFATLVRSTRRMQRLVADLLDVTGFDTGALSSKLEVHDVNRLVDDVASEMYSLAAERGIELSLEPAPDLQVCCDHARTVQILCNLISNSIKFTPRGGRIIVTARADGSEVRFSVRDTGPGIEASVLPQIFERHVRGHEAATQGHGLGLFIAKTLVEAQGGSIGVDTQAGAGSEFYFRLPLAAGGDAHRDHVPPLRILAPDRRLP